MAGSVRGARQNHIARQQRREAGDRGDLLGNAVNQVRRGAGSQLDILAIQREGDLRILPIQVVTGHDPRAERAGRVEALRTRPHRVEPLQVAQCHVIHAGEAEHIVHGLFDRHVLGDTTHHHGHFRLEIHVVRI